MSRKLKSFYVEMAKYCISGLNQNHPIHISPAVTGDQSTPDTVGNLKFFCFIHTALFDRFRHQGDSFSFRKQRVYRDSALM